MTTRKILQETLSKLNSNIREEIKNVLTEEISIKLLEKKREKYKKYNDEFISYCDDTLNEEQLANNKIFSAKMEILEAESDLIRLYLFSEGEL